MTGETAPAVAALTDLIAAHATPEAVAACPFLSRFVDADGCFDYFAAAEAFAALIAPSSEGPDDG